MEDKKMKITKKTFETNLVVLNGITFFAQGNFVLAVMNSRLLECFSFSSFNEYAKNHDLLITPWSRGSVLDKNGRLIIKN